MPEADVDRFSGKVIGLLGLGVFAAWLFGYEFRIWFASPTGGEFLALILLAALSLAVLVVTVFVVKGMQVMAAGAFLQVAAIWATLEGKFSLFTLLGLAALFMFLVGAFGRGREDILNSVRIKFFRIAYRSVAVATTGFVLFATFYLVGSLNLSQASFHRGAIDFLLSVSESTTDNIIPGFSGEKSVDAVLRAFIVAKADPEISEAEIQESIKAVKEEIEKATGFGVDGSKRFSDAIYDLTVAKVVSLAPAYKIFMLLVAGILIFALVKGLALFLNLFVVSVAFVAYQALIALNFMSVRLEPASREIIIVD